MHRALRTTMVATAAAVCATGLLAGTVNAAQAEPSDSPRDAKTWSTGWAGAEVNLYQADNGKYWISLQYGEYGQYCEAYYYNLGAARIKYTGSEVNGPDAWSSEFLLAPEQNINISCRDVNGAVTEWETLPLYPPLNR